MQLVELQDGNTDIEKRGFRLAAVSYDQPATLKAFAARRGLTYPLLSDPKSETIEAYGLRDPDYAKGSKAYGVPKPVILVIGADGTIRAKLHEASYTQRPSVGLILETLDKLAP